MSRFLASSSSCRVKSEFTSFIRIEVIGANIYAHDISEFLRELVSLWPDSKTKTPGLSPSSLAKGTKLNLQTVLNDLDKENPRIPNSEGKEKLGEFFRVYFVDDWDRRCDNAKVLKNEKALLEISQKASA